MSNSSRESEQRDWYTRYYVKSGADRNDLRLNREVLFQTLANEFSFIRAFRQIAAEPPKLRVLDVGCGSAATWYQLFRLGINPSNTVGIDIQSDRLSYIGNLYPHATAVLGDACRLPFADQSFDLVYESTLFATLTSSSVRSDVASEMIRVCKANGYLLLVDWRAQKFWSPHHGSLSKRQLGRLFGVGQACRLICVTRGSLLPPLGRLLSAYAWPLYFLIAWLCPPLVGQVAYLLQKEPNSEVIS